MATKDSTKPNFQQSIKGLTDYFQALMVKISPRLGFAYLVLMLIGVTSVVYMVSQTMQSVDAGQGTVTNQKLSEYVIPFDQVTISKLKQLNSDNVSPNVSLPSGRINPFSESTY